jgi:hypothetical protein
VRVSGVVNPIVRKDARSVDAFNVEAEKSSAGDDVTISKLLSKKEFTKNEDISEKSWIFTLLLTKAEVPTPTFP